VSAFYIEANYTPVIWVDGYKDRLPHRIIPVNCLDNLSRFHALLKDETRRRILEILGEQGKAGFKDLRETLNISVGTLYYHLDILGDFITQDKSRKYQLNERGRLLYQALKEGRPPPAFIAGAVLSNRLLSLFFMSTVLSQLASSLKWLPLSITILILGAIGAGFARLDSILLFFLQSGRSFDTAFIIFFFCWIGIFLFLDLMAFIVYRRSGEDFNLLTCIGFSALPIATYPYLHLALTHLTESITVIHALRAILLCLCKHGLLPC
jgi:DNA-binding transcriptional ArsR family regulator